MKLIGKLLWTTCLVNKKFLTETLINLLKFPFLMKVINSGLIYYQCFNVKLMIKFIYKLIQDKL